MILNIKIRKQQFLIFKILITDINFIYQYNSTYLG